MWWISIFIILAVVLVKAAWQFRKNYLANLRRAKEMERGRKRFEFFANGA